MDYIDTLKKYVSGKKYANKNIKTPNATGYITATGISKQYSNQNDFNVTAGKNNCPSDFVQLTPNWTILQMQHGGD
jgi:hypothetical protein